MVQALPRFPCEMFDTPVEDGAKKKPKEATQAEDTRLSVTTIR
jgi:hypothetical protein